MKLKDDYTDKELLADIRSAQTDAMNRGFAFLYQKHLQSFAYFVRSKNGLAEEAKDIFQEGIMIFYKKARQPGLVIEYASTFFFSICKNLWLEKIRQKANREKILREITPLEEASDDLEASLEKERNNILLLLLEKLGDGCQAILLNFYYEKKNMQEIAQEMAFASEAVAKNKKSNCMKKLRELIAGNRNYWEVLKQ
jgi:RNA polymerase sigma factor (sigma-70 family)